MIKKEGLVRQLTLSLHFSFLSLLVNPQRSETSGVPSSLTPARDEHVHDSITPTIGFPRLHQIIGNPTSTGMIPISKSA